MSLVMFVLCYDGYGIMASNIFYKGAIYCQNDSESRY